MGLNSKQENKCPCMYLIIPEYWYNHKRRFSALDYLTIDEFWEQAKLQVKKDTPAFSVLKPVVISIERSSPKRSQILAVWLFLGCLIGAGIVLLKQNLSVWKQRWTDTNL